MFNKNNLTYKDAIEWSMNIWLWLSETGEGKANYIAEVDDYVADLELRCPLCEYITQSDNKCEDCCLLDFCEDPYHSWQAAGRGGEERKELARECYNILNKEYNKIIAKEEIIY
jgi:hypothetical protein